MSCKGNALKWKSKPNAAKIIVISVVHQDGSFLLGKQSFNNVTIKVIILLLYFS